MPYDLLIFDWDGTLMDSEARIVACMQAAARDAGCPVPPRETVREVIGLGLDHGIRHVWPEADDATVRRLVSLYRDHFIDDAIAPSLLFDGVRPALEDLAGRGYRLAVATGKGRRGLLHELRETALDSLFAVTRCADETAPKPDPRMVHEILDHTGVGPDRALVIGDTEFDVRMAAGAGVPALGVETGVHAAERLLDAGAVACIAAACGVGDWLENGPARAT